MESHPTADVIIPLSKGKIALILIGCIVIVAGGIGIWSNADTQTRSNPLYLKGLAIACVFFFGICSLYGCLKLFDRIPGLIIDAEGIVDNSSGVAAGRIPWKEITGLKVSSIVGQKFVTIEVIDPQSYIERGGVIQRMLNAANTKMLGSPINISSSSLRISFDELVCVLTESLEKYQQAGRAGR